MHDRDTLWVSLIYEEATEKQGHRELSLEIFHQQRLVGCEKPDKWKMILWPYTAYHQILSGPPLFQKVLFHYLDSEAPALSAPSSDKGSDGVNKTSGGNHSPVEFSNLILLFHELITHDVFSHNHYLSGLVTDSIFCLL